MHPSLTKDVTSEEHRGRNHTHRFVLWPKRVHIQHLRLCSTKYGKTTGNSYCLIYYQNCLMSIFTIVLAQVLLRQVVELFLSGKIGLKKEEEFRGVGEAVIRAKSEAGRCGFKSFSGSQSWKLPIASHNCRLRRGSNASSSPTPSRNR